jgi:hypothetical protein
MELSTVLQTIIPDMSSSSLKLVPLIIIRLLAPANICLR